MQHVEINISTLQRCAVKKKRINFIKKISRWRHHCERIIMDTEVLTDAQIVRTYRHMCRECNILESSTANTSIFFFFPMCYFVFSSPTVNSICTSRIFLVCCNQFPDIPCHNRNMIDEVSWSSLNLSFFVCVVLYLFEAYFLSDVVKTENWTENNIWLKGNRRRRCPVKDDCNRPEIESEARQAQRNTD